MKSSLVKASVMSLAIAAIVVPVAVGCGGGGSNESGGDTSSTPAGQTPQAARGGVAGKLTPRTGDFAGLCKRSGEKQFSAPTTVIDPSRAYTAVLKTAKGDITIELNPQAAPITVNSFVFLACSGYYDGVTFHRVIPGFVAQGGDPTGTGRGGPGYTIPDEFGDIEFTPGIVAMAKTGAPNSGGSQFFICFDMPEQSKTALFGNYTVFGQVTAGMDVASKLTPRDPAKNPNAAPGDVIQSITVTEH